MKFTTFSLKTLLLLGLTYISVSSSAYAQAVERSITIKNNSSETVKEYMLEVPVEKLKLSIGNYRAEYKGKTVPVEVITDIYGKQKAIVLIDNMQAGEEFKVSLKQGNVDAYPKRTYAELSHKIGGQFEGYKYVGDYSWIKTNYITVPGDFRDHSYYIKYEGPGWENDKVAFRFYLDNRNAIDVYGKKTTGIVLPFVGVDGFDSYHNMSIWGMDNLKVGKALGIGTIAIWDGSKAVRVEKRDSTTSFIPADGKLRSQVKTIYYGWDANGTKCDLTSLITIDAGNRASRMELLVSKDIDNITTGVNKDKNVELIVNHNPENTWSYVATFGKQSLNKDMQGLAVFARTSQVKEITSDDLNHVMILAPENGYVEYYFMPTWELDVEPVATKEQFINCLNEVLNTLNSNVTYKIT